MPATRRDFLRMSSAYAVGFAGLRTLLESPARAGSTAVPAGYGPLVPDPEGLLDLPRGFAYRIISRAGEEMDDGLLLPSEPDGMAAFALDADRCVVMRNHELSPEQPGAFGEQNARFGKIDAAMLFDRGSDKTPSTGGVSSIVYNTAEQRVERQFLRLGGTIRNCAGGPTPWGSWITCEEATDTPGINPLKLFRCDESHGYAFDVPASSEPGLVKAEPLRAMGRFRREAVAVDPEAGIVYQTEDIDDGCLYRFVPNEPMNLAAGGKLQALAIEGRPSLDTRNWAEDPAGPAGPVDPAAQGEVHAVAIELDKRNGETDLVRPGERMALSWVDLDDVESPEDDLRHRAFEAGAARFARGEGMWWSDGSAYFACTSGGHARLGQLFKITPGSNGSAGTLELFIEPNDSALIHNADNLTAAPWGDLIVCEDRKDPQVRLVGVTPDGELYTLANNHTRGEFAGVCFSPDGSTLFVNIQHSGLTVAVTGPWRA